MATLSSGHRQSQLNGAKRHAFEDARSERPQKKTKGLLEEDDSSETENSASDSGGVPIANPKASLNGHGFTVNQEFARRFEHNKKREELQRLEEKYGNPSTSRGGGNGAGSEDDSSDGSETSTESEEEDDDGVLASEIVDAQIQSTLEAIRRKDPRVYDEKVKFYTDLDEEAQGDRNDGMKKIKPMYLNDYHRRNLLEGSTTDEAPNDEPVTYAQQQDDLKNVIVKEMHAAVNDDEGPGDDESNGSQSDHGFLVKKPSTSEEKVLSKPGKRRQQELDVEAAYKDPETYLSNFMSARAWVPSEGSRFQPFESDNEEEERQAELFEEAYNLRFENPKASNEKLLSHARDAAAKYSVRKEDMNPRKKAREAERAKKEGAKQTREEEKARLRKLKVAEAEEKVQKIKEAAGYRGKVLQEEELTTFLEEGWDDVHWDQEMNRRFGDDYYAGHDSDANTEGSKGKRKMKKPKWEDDIDIGDLVPDFDEAENQNPHFSLTDEESDVGGALIANIDGLEDGAFSAELKSKKADMRRGEGEQQKTARQERRKIERLIDQQMGIDETLSSFSKKHAGHFRYRETSPTAYGLTSHDILMASDSQLNQYAGLKKMAVFRDPGKKKKDKKHLGKKARLRQWREDTFGNEQGPQKTLAEVLAGQNMASNKPKAGEGNDLDIRERNKKTRSKKSKATNPL